MSVCVKSAVCCEKERIEHGPDWPVFHGQASGLISCNSINSVTCF